MSIEFRCVNCRATYEVSTDLAGETMKCRECGVRSRVGPAPNEPAHFRAALGYAESIVQVAQFVVAVGVVGSIILFISGMATGHAVEVVVVVMLAGVQMYFISAGSKLALSLTQVFVSIGRDVRVVRLRSNQE